MSVYTSYYRWLGIGLSLLLTAACHPDKPAQTEAAAPSELAVEDTLPAALPRSTADSVTWHRASRVPAASAPLIRPGGVRRQVLPRDTTAPPPLEAKLYDLTLKASEFHKIDPTRLAEVRGREGTVLRIPANSFVTASNAAPTGTIFVEMKECYGLADMVLSNLLTETTDDQLLGAGGMVLVRATAQGQPLHLATDHSVQVEMPIARRAELQPYAGQSGKRQPVRWAALGADVAPAFDEQIYTDAQPMPTYHDDNASLSQLIRYPAAARAQHTEGNVFVSLVIDETGRVLNPKILRGLGNGCNEEALRVLRQSSGHWTPGLRDGRLVKVKMLVPVHFALPPAGSATDSTYVATAAAEEAEETSSSGTTAPAANHYVFNTDHLGWLAAARPRRSADAVTTFAAAIEPDTHTSVRLLLPDAAPTIVLGQPSAENYQFVDVPANKKAVLVGIRYYNSTPFVALRDIVTGRHEEEPLTFKETTLEDLEELLAKLRAE